MNHIAIQSLLRPALTPVPRCKDYAIFQQTLQNIDRFLIDSHLESQAIEMALEGWEQAGAGDRQSRARYAIRALRMEVLRFLLGGISLRKTSLLLGSSDLLADFAGRGRWTGFGRSPKAQWDAVRSCLRRNR